MRILYDSRIRPQKGIGLSSRGPALHERWRERLIDDYLLNPVAMPSVNGDSIADHFEWIFPQRRLNEHKLAESERFLEEPQGKYAVNRCVRIGNADELTGLMLLRLFHYQPSRPTAHLTQTLSEKLSKK
jgi:hypothetical protein